MHLGKSIGRSSAKPSTNYSPSGESRGRLFSFCQHYIGNELRIDQSNSARPKEFPTVETYERHLVKRIIPR
jgi:hypothetical protein